MNVETELIVGDDFDGFSFQLNSFSPINNTITYQQLGRQFNGQQIGCWVNTWIDRYHPLNQTDVVDQINFLASNITGNFSAGTVFSVTVLFDSNNNIKGGVFFATVDGTNYRHNALQYGQHELSATAPRAHNRLYFQYCRSEQLSESTVEAGVRDSHMSVEYK
jgi:hypothetical protein